VTNAVRYAILKQLPFFALFDDEELAIWRRRSVGRLLSATHPQDPVMRRAGRPAAPAPFR
jgi:hypothetical protein